MVMSGPRVSNRKYTFKDLHSEKLHAQKPIFAFFLFFSLPRNREKCDPLESRPMGAILRFTFT